ncbi:MAG: DUF3231 family protein [Bacillota bacterium]
MVFTLIPNRQDVKQRNIDVREAYLLWDLLGTQYLVIERFKVLLNDSHDVDLKVIISHLTKLIEKHSKEVEGYLLRFSILSPDRNRESINFPKNSEVLTDQFIARELHVFLQEHIEKLMRAHRTAFTNDDVRDYFKKLIIIKVNELDSLIKYLKLKGWIETPPLFHRTPMNVTEKISSNEIFHLWHHLTFRYDNINTTEIIIKYTFDGDFKTTLYLGLKLLQKQVQLLEKELDYFGIPLPSRPGVVTFTPMNTEILKDDHMFRTLIDGLQGASLLHIQPLKECTFNDRIRGIFKTLLLEEIDLIDNFYKYGKLKGWFHAVPI